METGKGMVMLQETTQRRVRVIPATRERAAPNNSPTRRKRVAAYCRVSTDSEEQLTSYKAQKAYYTQTIAESPEWEMVGIFADEPVIIGLNQNEPFNRGNVLI